MASKRIGKLPARYAFILNQYPEERLSKCPLCNRPTHTRKFALFVHVDQWGSMVLGKTCKYCARCEMIIAHQHELESELAHSFSRIAPEMMGNEYLVIGTVEKRLWQQGVKGNSPRFEETLEHTADFKKIYDFTVEPGGWYPADDRNQKR